ncbi:hypothetical protein BBK82_43490 [Lentzea guizhouensis]|uniref:NACHT domain-containing protein n=1 Tax=Lentzea guizhouensis TaxID=1586287 RepID=A0A1B2HVM7_9PSEU|nr:NACHT domain-containing protein [Lentzea guizhouensis]ANZ41789.1 hypothetical protein BBK82_43490 [Lentzea guizhouensis]
MQYNQFAGTNSGVVIQARDIIAGPPQAVEDNPLIHALYRATVEVTEPGDGRGVCIAPNLVLTAAELVPPRLRLPQAPSLAVVSWPTADRPFPCLHQAVAPESLSTTLEQVPGSPVLNRMTGAVCGIMTTAGPVVVPELDVPLDQRWLDLLTPEQLAQGGWRHLSPDLREYLRAVQEQGNEHEYRFDGHSAPSLRRIYLKRWATPKSADDATEPPESINAEDLLTTCEGAQILGEAGMGKSSLVRYFAAVSAEKWLHGQAGQAVPVPITAKALAADGQLPDLLARGVRLTTLPEQRLVELFSGPPLPGVPWLVLVDGLDELVDAGAQDDLIRRVLRLRREERYRFVVTSRHLGGIRFNQHRHPTYVLSRFNHRDLRQFITTWFQEEDMPEDAATELFTRLRHTKLFDLAHVPLLATMLCVLSCAGETTELPRDQTDLYERFVKWQLSKVWHNDVRTKLREWQARSGASAEEAADALLSELRPLLQEMAHASLRSDVNLFDFAVARYPALAPEAVREALLASGLVVGSERALAFRHETIKEFLAACHLFAAKPEPERLLRPRLTRRGWPDLEVLLFLAAMVDNDVLNGLLRRALWWPFRRRHMEFLTALVSHGVDVDDDVRNRMVRLLKQGVQSPSSDSEVWRQHVEWLRRVDQDTATWLLRDLVEQPGEIDPFRRFEAVRYLVELDARANEPVILAFLRRTDLLTVARDNVHGMLKEIDPELDLRIFTDLVSTAPEHGLRLHAAWTVLGQDQAVGMDLLVNLAQDTSTDDWEQIATITAVDRYDSEAGLRLWHGLLRSARTTASRVEAMEVCFTRDREPTERYLMDHLDDAGTRPRVKFDIAHFLVPHKLVGPGVMLDLAADAGLTVDERVRIATQYWYQHREKSEQLVESALHDAGSEPTVLLDVIAKIDRVDSTKAKRALNAMVENFTHPEHIRLTAAERLPRSLSVQAYEYLALLPNFSEDSSLDAAARAYRLDATAGTRIYRRLIDMASSDATKARWAIEAKQVHGHGMLEDLLAGTDLSYDVQLLLAPHLGRREAVKLLRRIAANGDTAQQMEAAEKMVSIGGKAEAVELYLMITNSSKVPKRTRERAQAEADRLSAG